MIRVTRQNKSLTWVLWSVPPGFPFALSVGYDLAMNREFGRLALSFAFQD